ncbi:uncharacterized protein MELLADRAFT_111469 [Melampsora larici-populina 98AG31]|uniref:Uncharacterized protein n=1 Tax=Melampsora larici-populina (strain 98AG31 / pathotype 3-4-7) TaxID=747676 RepID=F4S3A4_MELLP|nr:uncharacterized protein MELLADRAFT_111469 [Melampsora larici-populina 98AG31]EGG00783.1 hypothetical protein MELLADRAFT_111469 [Melampsora larici-populina 98AG31]
MSAEPEHPTGLFNPGHADVADLPPPVHIYTIPLNLRYLVTLDLRVLQQRITTADDLREFLKCFYHTIPHLRHATKPELIGCFMYYILPILQAPKVYDEARGIIYSFDVPFQIELAPEPVAGNAGNDGHNGVATLFDTSKDNIDITVT